MKLTRVTQEDDTGCGIACVAMLACISYRESKTIFLEDVFSRKRRKYWTYHKHIEAALDAAGIRNRRRRFSNWADFEGIAVVPVDRNKRTRNYHWIVAVRRGKHVYLYDPEEVLPHKRVRFGRPTVRGYYIQIGSVGDNGA